MEDILMFSYLLRRIAQTIPVLLGLSLLIFLLLRALPGDPALLYSGFEATAEELADLRERMGVNKPLFSQYLSFIGPALRGDLGTSLRSGRPVLTELKMRLPVTAELAGLSLLSACFLGIGLGISAAIKPKLITPLYLLSILGFSMPIYWLGLLLILFFSIRLGWLPPAGGMGKSSLILPVVTLMSSTAASLFRLTLSEYQEVTAQEYMRVAKAKGISSLRLHYKHGLRNTLIPLVTFIELEFGNLLGGAVLTESVFALNGIGRYLVTSVVQRDYPVIQGAVMLICSIFIFIHLVMDLIYLAIDPRLRRR